MNIIVKAPKGWEWLIGDTLTLYSEKYSTWLSDAYGSSSVEAQNAIVNEARDITRSYYDYQQSIATISKVRYDSDSE